MRGTTSNKAVQNTTTKMHSFKVLDSSPNWLHEQKRDIPFHYIFRKDDTNNSAYKSLNWKPYNIKMKQKWKAVTRLMSFHNCTDIRFSIIWIHTFQTARIERHIPATKYDTGLNKQIVTKRSTALLLQLWNGIVQFWSNGFLSNRPYELPNIYHF